MISKKTRNFFKQKFETKEIKKAPIVFLDRDGTINEEAEFITKTSQIHIFRNSIKAIKLLNSVGFRIVIVTNQPVIARGLITPEEALRINEIFHTKLKTYGAGIDAIYTCPHHPKANIFEFRVNCKCRKPQPLMLKAAAKDFNVKAKDC